MAFASLKLVICLILCVLLVDHSQPEPDEFPLDNCHQAPIDLFFAANPFLSFYEFLTQLEIFTRIAKVFLSSEDVNNSRVRIAVGQDEDDWRFSEGVPMFQEYNLANQVNVDAMITSLWHRMHFDHGSVLRTMSQVIDTAFFVRGARSDAVHVAILILEPYFGDDGLDYFERIKQNINPRINLFIFVIDILQYIDGIRRYLPVKNTAVIQHITFLFGDDYIPMALCKQCSPGWIPFLHNKGEHIMSCYKLDIAPTNIDWLTALERSAYYQASLACMELEEELEYLQDRISYLLDEQEDKIQAGDVSSNGDVKVYIGLNRNMKTKDKRFQWTINGFVKRYFPLTITHWMPGNPDGGFTQMCGAWVIYRLNESTSTYKGSENKIQNGYSTFQKREGWKDAGCGNPLTRFSLFEIVLPRVPVVYPAFLQASSVTFKDNKTVPTSKEISEYDGKLVSLASYVKDEAFLSFTKNTSETFPLFDCGESDGENKYISYTEVCDRVDHCPNRRDEYICQYRRCTISEFQCNSGHCVESGGRCDNFIDCPDESDEDNCFECKGYRCCDGSCLPQHWAGDGEVDCFCYDEFDGSVLSDELPAPIGNGNITGQADDVCVLICNRTNCVYPHQLADGVIDCAGPEGPLDETLGKLQRADSCWDKMGRSLWAPRCVYVKDRYGSVLGCRDMSHLSRCEDFECQEGYIKCPNSYCIPLHFIQNGQADCPMGEDEFLLLDGKDRDCRGNFLCWGSSICLHPDLVCDGHPHCPNGDDELNCHVTCPEGFNCIAGTITVSDYNKSVPLLSITEFDPRSRYIDLSGIDISGIDNSKHFINLVEVVFSNCSLKDYTRIIGRDLMGFETVYSMDLSYNLIETIGESQGVFRGMSNLHVLNLSHNYNLKIVKTSPYTASPFNSKVLEVLDLSYTSIVTLEESIFTSLVHLETLNLAHTFITDINEIKFPANFRLHELDLRATAITDFDKNSFNGLIIEADLYTDNPDLCCPQVRGSGIPAHTCHAPTDAISSCYDLIGSEVQRILLWLMAVVALVGNVTVIVYRFVWDRGVLKLTYGLFVTNLAASDLIMGIYLLIIAGADTYYRNVYVWNDRTWRESLACKVSGFLGTFSSETSVFFIFLVTLDRYFVIKYPFGQIRFSKVGKVVAVSLAWMAGFTLALIPMLSVFSGENTIFSTNPVCLGLPLTDKHSTGWGYSFSVFIVLNFVMFMVIAFGQLAIFNAMSGNRVEKEASIKSATRRSQDIQVAKQLSMIALSDFLCWFPVGLMGLLALGGTEISPDAYSWTAVLVLPVNAALNPVLYTVPVLIARWEKFKRGESSQTS